MKIWAINNSCNKIFIIWETIIKVPTSSQNTHLPRCFNCSVNSKQCIAINIFRILIDIGNYKYYSWSMIKWGTFFVQYWKYKKKKNWKYRKMTKWPNFAILTKVTSVLQSRLYHPTSSSIIMIDNVSFNKIRLHWLKYPPHFIHIHDLILVWYCKTLQDKG